MNNPYSQFRKDPDPANERLVTTPVRQTSSTRVLEPVANTAPVVASVYNSSTTVSGPPDDGSGALVMPWNAEITDTDTLHDTGVNPERVTIPATKPGIYRISARIIFIANGTTTNRIVNVRVNGTIVKTVTVAASAGSNIAVYIEHEQFLNGGQYYDLLLNATGGAGTNADISGGIDNSSMIVVKLI